MRENDFIPVTARDRDIYIAFVFYGLGLQRVHGSVTAMTFVV